MHRPERLGVVKKNPRSRDLPLMSSVCFPVKLQKSLFKNRHFRESTTITIEVCKRIQVRYRGKPVGIEIELKLIKFANSYYTDIRFFFLISVENNNKLHVMSHNMDLIVNLFPNYL